MSKPSPPRPPNPPAAPAKPPVPRVKITAKPPEQELAEVERAMSVLQGRHPEAVRAERETQKALLTQKAKTDAASAASNVEESRRAKRRAAMAILASVVIVTAAVLALVRRARASALDRALSPLAAPYVALGFTPVVPSFFGSEARVELNVPDGTCLVAVASRAPDAPPAQAGHEAELRVQHGARILTGEGSIGWCTCGPEPTVVSPVGAEAGGGVRVVRIDASAVGGDHGLPFLASRPRLVAPPDACSSDHLDAWLAAHAYPSRAADASGLDDARVAKLRAVGFRPVASAPSELPFAIVEPLEESCFLAMSSEEGDLLSLRAPGGVHSIDAAKSPIAWCDPHAGAATVWRGGKAPLTVFAAPAVRIGGTVGLREVAARAGLGVLSMEIDRAAIGWDASQILRASGVAPPELTVTTDATVIGHARVVALSSIGGATFIADAHGDAAFVCAPALASVGDLTPRPRSLVCAENTAIAWRSTGVGKGSAAHAPLPFWMEVFTPVQEADALKTELALLAIARRLSGEGFEATILDGVKELEDGVDVLGRGGDHGVVVVGMVPEWPWAIAYTDGPTWKLDGDPRVVPIEAGAHVTLRIPRPTGPRDARRTVVWRAHE